MEFDCEDATARFQKYVATYSGQRHYTQYSQKTFIDDMLYGIGIAINKANHEYAGGFDRFKALLRDHLGQ